MPRLAVLALLLLAACRCGQKPANPADLRAVVEDGDELAILDHLAGGWTKVGSLPAAARAIRVSPGGQHFAWVEDRTDERGNTMQGFLRLDRGSTAPLGTLGCREHEAFGLAVDDGGRALFLAPEGLAVRGAAERRADASEPVCGPGGCAHVEGACVSTTLALAGPVCGDALRPLDVRAGRLLARTNASLVLADARGVTSLAMTDVQEGRLGPGDSWLVVRRVQEGGRVEDQLLTGKIREIPHEVLRAPVLLNARFLPTGQLVAVRAAGDLLDNLLAHAPDEYGGEALAGEAVTFDPLAPAAIPVPGLAGKRVRLVTPLPGL